MDSLTFELQIVLYFQLFLSANVRHNFDSVHFCSLQACNVKSDQKLGGLLFAQREHFSAAPEKGIWLDHLLCTQTS